MVKKKCIPILIAFLFLFPLINAEIDISFNDDDIPQVIIEHPETTATTAGNADGNASSICAGDEVLLGNGSCQTSSDYAGSTPITNIFDQNLNKSDNVIFSNVNVTGGFFGWFNWTTFTSWLGFDGSVLTFNETRFNTSVTNVVNDQGLGSNPFDQSLNTTDDVSFNNVILDNSLSLRDGFKPINFYNESDTGFYRIRTCGAGANELCIRDKDDVARLVFSSDSIGVYSDMIFYENFVKGAIVFPSIYGTEQESYLPFFKDYYYSGIKRGVVEVVYNRPPSWDNPNALFESNSVQQWEYVSPANPVIINITRFDDSSGMVDDVIIVPHWRNGYPVNYTISFEHSESGAIIDVCDVSDNLKPVVVCPINQWRVKTIIIKVTGAGNGVGMWGNLRIAQIIGTTDKTRMSGGLMNVDGDDMWGNLDMNSYDIQGLDNLIIDGDLEVTGSIFYSGGELGSSMHSYGESEREITAERYYIAKNNLSEYNFLVTGQYTGGVDRDYLIEIDVINNTDYNKGVGCVEQDYSNETFTNITDYCTYFKWSNDYGATWEEEEIVTQSSFYDLEDGIKIGWSCPSGNCNFSVGDQFNFTALTSPIYNLKVDTLNSILLSESVMNNFSRDVYIGEGLNVNNGVFVVDDVNNRVGINEDNPQYDLDIEGDMAIKTTLFQVDANGNVNIW